MKNLLIITTGGTIASEPTEHGLSPAGTGEKFLDCVPIIKEKYNVTCLALKNIDSSNIRPADWQDIAQSIKDNYQNYDGFVITHGTDTLAYTASALYAMLTNLAKTVVITGAQYPITAPITDAKKNLYDSVITAMESGLNGVFVVFNGKIMQADKIKKIRTKDFDAFESIGTPNVATIDNNRINGIKQPAKSQDEPIFYTKLEENITLIKLHPMINIADFTHIKEKYKAVVVECYGVGGVPDDFAEFLIDLATSGIIILIVSQVTYDGTDLKTYTAGNTLAQTPNVREAGENTLEASMTKLMLDLASQG